MDKLKGSGSTFSTSGKRWYPFRGASPAVAASIGRRARIRHAMPADKATARAMCEEACRHLKAPAND